MSKKKKIGRPKKKCTKKIACPSMASVSGVVPFSFYEETIENRLKRREGEIVRLESNIAILKDTIDRIVGVMVDKGYRG